MTDTTPITDLGLSATLPTIGWDAERLRSFALSIKERYTGLVVTEDEIAKDFAGRIELVQANVRQASNTYRQGWELRDVECVEIKDLNKGTMTVIRQDTGEIVRMRKLSQSEMQGNLLDAA